jgi:hypothetical protein
VASQSIIQDLKAGSFIKIGKHEKCNDDEYVLSIVEADNKEAHVWLSEVELLRLTAAFMKIFEHKLNTEE